MRRSLPIVVAFIATALVGVAQAQQPVEPREPIGAAPEDRGSVTPGQEAEAPRSPGAFSRSPEADELTQPAEETTPEIVGPEATMPPEEVTRGRARPSQPSAQGTRPEESATAGGAATAAAAGRATQQQVLRQGVSEQPRRMAMAEIDGEAEADVEGMVVLTEDERGVLLEANLAGLEPGSHRVVIRDATTCGEAAEMATRATRLGEEEAARAAPTVEQAREARRRQRAEAEPTTGERTLGEVEVGRDGAARYRLLTDELSLERGGPDSVIGKTLVIEADASSAAPEDEVACGVIEGAG